MLSAAFIVNRLLETSVNDHVLVKSKGLVLLKMSMIAQYLLDKNRYPDLPEAAVQAEIKSARLTAAQVDNILDDDDEKAERSEAKADGTIDQYWQSKCEDIADSVANDIRRSAGIKEPTWQQWKQGNAHYFKTPSGEILTAQTAEEYWAIQARIGKQRVTLCSPPLSL
jgi:hypothetical protein